MGEDRRARRRRRRPRPRPGQGARGDRWHRSTSSCRATGPCPSRRTAGPGRPLRVPDPQSLDGAVELTIIDVEANGYRLRLVDHPAAFDRDGFYGPPGGGDFADNAWRFGLFCRAALEALRAESRSTGRRHPPPRLARRARRRSSATAGTADDPVLGRAADRPDAPQPRLSRLDAARGARPARAGAGRRDRRRAAPTGIDLLAAGIERAEMVNTVSPGYARESLTPGARVRARRSAAGEGRPLRRDPQRPRHDRLEPGNRRRPRGDVFGPTTWPARRPAGPTC